MLENRLGLEGLTYTPRAFNRPRIWPEAKTTIEKRIYSVPDTLEAAPDDLRFIEQRLKVLPAGWRKKVTSRYTALYVSGAAGRGAANAWLREVTELARRAPMSLTADEDAIRAKAKSLAIGLRRVGATGCRATLQAYGIKEPPVSKDEYLVARCRDEHFWRRRLRRRLSRIREDVGREIGLIHRRADLYVTEVGLNCRRQQRARNETTLQTLVAVNDDGEEFDLDELIERSIANPANRRAELMLRMRGFETVAEELGHVGDFWTLTAPSRFHAIHSRSGEQNARFDGSTVRDAHAHLKGIWARIRAAFKRADIQPYGFRVVEPHHDGAPHWHTLVFLPRSKIEAARAIVRRHALEDAPDEPGAVHHRCKFERIDPNQGSATGYIAKYIAKNIDGYALTADDPFAPDETAGRDPAATAERVRAWASTHGIRQFQQVGGPPVGVWREARRLTDEQTGVVERLRQNANAPDWAAFVKTMGGPTRTRDEWPVRVALLEWWMTDTGELETNRYGEPASLKPFGLDSNGEVIQTRKRWEIHRRPMTEIQPGFPISNDATRVSASASSVFPWSSVNNCTVLLTPGRTLSAGATAYPALGSRKHVWCRPRTDEFRDDVFELFRESSRFHLP